MAHLVETMAYAGQVPWHGLGERVSNDLSPMQMMQKAKVDWSVTKENMYILDGISVPNKKALLRGGDNKVLDIVGDDWEPVQNEEAFNFFNEYCAAGDMEMHTAGSLMDGKIVWVLAKIKESFDVLPGDQVDNFLLFTNPHRYGQSLNVRMTPIRVVCNNTLQMSLSSKSKNEVSLNHRRTFDADLVKQQLGIAHQKFDQYKEFAQFLANKKAKSADVIQFVNKVFPHSNTKGRDVKDYEDLSPSAKRAMDARQSQPGAEYAEGTWWNALNAVTYLVDHELGRSDDTRITSAWYGYNAKRKLIAVNTAIEMAEAA
jgi:phage/plasmid-like protein (TIGR03299 family)